jgi:hypothetical protein
MRNTFLCLSLALFAALALTATVSAEEGWGTIKGQVVWAGDVPAPKNKDVTADQKHCLGKGPIPDEEFVINKDNKGVRWVFVWLMPVPPAAGGAKPEPLPIHPALKEIKEKEAVLDQPCCKFEPHALALRQGQTLVIKNSAPVNHNSNLQGGSTNPSFNPLIPAGGEFVVKDLVASTSVIPVSCNIHPWMSAKIRVFDHPYFAITDADGKFDIKDAPAGDFRLIIWHEGVGWVSKSPKLGGDPVTIKKDGVTDLGKMEMKPPKD